MPETSRDPTAADAAFATLLQELRPRAAALLRRLSPRFAEDLLQETLARAWRYRDGCDPAANPAGWLLQVAFRAFLDHRARCKREAIADDDTVRHAGSEPRDAVAPREELARALARLSDLQRALLLGFHRDGLSLRELADRHALPVGTVKSHLHRARQALVRPEAEDRP